MPPRKKLSKAKLRALEAQQNRPRKSGKMRRMSAMTDEGGKASRKRLLDDAGVSLPSRTCMAGPLCIVHCCCLTPVRSVGHIESRMDRYLQGQATAALQASAA